MSDTLWQILIYGLVNGAILALNAISVTVVYSTVRTLNLAHGDVFALSTVFVTMLLINLGVSTAWPPLLLVGVLALALIGAVLLGLLLNVGIDRLAFRPFRQRSRLAPLIATLGLSFMLFQFALLLRTLQRSWIPGEHRSVPGLPEVPTDGIPALLPTTDLIKALGLPFHFSLRLNELAVMLTAVIVTIAVSRFLARTATGRAIRACAQDATAALMCGVNLDRTIRRAFALGGALAGLAAFVFAMYYTRPYGSAGAESGLLAFAAAILGGVGSPVGALLASLLIGVFTAFSDFALSAQWTPVLLLLLLIALLWLRPTGLTADGRDTDSGSLRDALLAGAAGQGRRWRWLWISFGIIAIFPLISAWLNLGWQISVKGIGIYILLALSMNLVLGLAGVLDLGFAVSFGVGGYVTALLTNRYNDLGAALPQPLDITVVLALSALAASIIGAIKGLLAGRLRSDYLAVATLAFGLMAARLVLIARSVTGGAGGLAAVPPPTLLTVTLIDPTVQYYLVFGLVILTALISRRLIQSRVGRAWVASGEDEVAAEASGVNVKRYRLLALVLSSALAGMAGGLYASNFAFVSPDLLAFHVTALTLAMAVLGGAGSISGAMLGAVLIIGYDKLFIPRLAAWLAQIQPDIYLGAVPDVRGTSYFNFGFALYLTVMLRANWPAWRARLRLRRAAAKRA